MPPSTGMSAPVVMLLRSEARNSAAFATWVHAPICHTRFWVAVGTVDSAGQPRFVVLARHGVFMDNGDHP